MTTQTEAVHAEEFLISEANGHRSRENVTVKSGQNLPAGAVIGIQTSGGAVAKYANTQNDGTQAAKGVLLQAVDATEGDKPGAILCRDAEVNGDLLDWNDNDGTGVTTGIADLLTLGIVVR